MHPPYPTISPGAPTTTAAQALHLTHNTLGAAIGVVCIVAWFVLHRFAAHRHPVIEWIARACLAAAGVALAASLGVVATWVGNANNVTANWLSSWLGDPTFTAKHWGLLTILAIIDVAFAVTVTVDLIRHLSKKGGMAAGGKPQRHPHWGAMEEMFNKYGWFGLGPLAATLPAPFGLWVVTWLTLLSETIGHALGGLFGMA
jgi:hypothetical protein